MTPRSLARPNDDDEDVVSAQAVTLISSTKIVGSKAPEYPLVNLNTHTAAAIACNITHATPDIPHATPDITHAPRGVLCCVGLFAVCAASLAYLIYWIVMRAT